MISEMVLLIGVGVGVGASVAVGDGVEVDVGTNVAVGVGLFPLHAARIRVVTSVTMIAGKTFRTRSRCNFELTLGPPPDTRAGPRN